MNHMKPQTKVNIVTLTSMIPAIAAIIVSSRMMVFANANQIVPEFLTTLFFAFSLMYVALMGWSALLQKKYPRRVK